MSVEISDHSLQIIAGLDLYPPSIQGSIVSDPSFRSEHDIEADALISFPNCKEDFQRSRLLKVIRQGFSESGNRLSVKDQQGNEWGLKVEVNGGNPSVRLSKGPQTFLLDAFWPLISDGDQRLAKFEKESQRIHLSIDGKSNWRKRLLKGPLSDDDMGELQRDFEETPFRVAEQLKREMLTGKSSLSSLVPQSIRYYDRLVGCYENSATILEYAQSEAMVHLQDLFSAGCYSGLISSLLMASHSSISQVLETFEFDEEELEQLYDWLVSGGDLISRIGAIELGLALLTKYPFLEKKIEILVQQLVDGNTEEQCKLLSALFMLVDGEIARLQIFRMKPPFFRRLASMAQASLIARCVAEAGVQVDSFSEWSTAQRGLFFYCQTFVDLRLEPRWQPDYLTPEQLKSEFLGRICSASNRYTTNVKGSTLKKLLLSEESDFSQSNIDITAFLPGPLEGNIIPSEMPPEISQIVEDGLSSGAPTPDSFIALVNSIQYWKLESSYTELALKIICDAKHQLSQTGNQDRVLTTLNGLARVAAVSKKTDLSEELRLLVRKYRSYLDVNSQPVQLMAIGLIAAAAYDELDDWGGCVGEWVTELSFLPLTSDGAKILFEWLKQLCILEPVLNCSCGRALAALESLNMGNARSGHSESYE